MGKFANALKTVGNAVNEYAAYNQEIKELTLKLMSKTSDVDYETAEKIARVLINQAEITWK